jgi:hypothetical protein
MIPMEKRWGIKRKVVLMLTLSMALNLLLSANEIQVGTSTTQNITVDYSLESVWNGTGVTKVLTSEEYLYFLKDGKKIIKIQNGQEKGNYTHNETIMDAEAWKTAVIIVDDTWDYYKTIDFENVTNPQITANITADGGNALPFSMYQQYLYLAGGYNYYVLDYSSPSSPTYRNSFRWSYHSWAVEVVADCGLFMGDTNTGVYYMEKNPTYPDQLWEVYYPNAYFTGIARSNGAMGVSDKYIAYFTNDVQRRDQTIILVIPRISKTQAKQPYNVSVEELDLTRGLIRENILVSTHLDKINLWSINEIKQTVDAVGTIVVPEIGSFSFWQWIENTDTFYVVNEEKGVFLLSFIITETPAIIPAIPSAFTFIILSCFTRWRRRKI